MHRGNDTMRKRLLLVAGVILALVILALLLAAYMICHHVRGAYFDSAGVNIHYTDQGAGEAVILVHGYAANSDVNWRLPGILRKLQRHFRVITMDVRGHGLSGKPHDVSRYGIETVNDVARLMDHLKIAKAHLVGYSMGGFITLKFASMHPERLISAMPCGAAWMTPAAPLCDLLNGIHARLIDKDAPSSGIASMMVALRRGALGTILDLEALRCVAEGFNELALTEAELRQITIPIMAVRGGRDDVVFGGADLKAALPGYQETIIPSGRHNTVIFYPRFQEALVGFLLAHPSVAR